MKRLFWKCAILVRALSLAIIILVSVSCKSMCEIATVQSSDTTSFIQKSTSVDTIYQHDSVFVREVMRGDTVYLTRTEWRDRWRTRVERDTVRDTEYITRTEYVDRIVEKPPERYVPKFYKRCTIALWAIIAAAIAYVLLRWWLRRKV